MAASRAVRTSFEWSARSLSRSLRCSSVDWRGTILTAHCSPVSRFLANFTLPILPAPIVFPRDHSPVVPPMVVRRLTVPVFPELLPGSTGLAAAGSCNAGSLLRAFASEIRELLREWPGLDGGRCESRVDSDRLRVASVF